MVPLAWGTRLRRLAGGLAGTGFWLGIGGFVGWAAVHFDQRWHVAGARRSALALGFVLCAIVGVLWLLASYRLFNEVRDGLAAERQGRPRPARDGIASLLAPLAAPIVGMIIALSVPSPPVASAGRPAAVLATRPPASVPAVPAARPTVQGHAEVVLTTVAAGETLATIAERVYGSAEDWPVLAEANLGRREPGGARFGDASVLRPGWVLAVPLPVQRGGEPVVSAGPEQAGGTASLGDAPTRASDLLGPLAAAGSLGAAIVALSLRRRRRLQLARAAAGERPVRPAADAAALGAWARPLERNDLLERLDLANRLLGRRVRERCMAPPPVAAVRAGPDGVELLLESPSLDAPPEFVVADAGRRWRLDPELDVSVLASLVGPSDLALLPVLLPLGEDGESSYLVAVQAGETLLLRAEERLQSALLSTTALLLDCAPWGEVELFSLGPCCFPGSALAQPIEEHGLRAFDTGAPVAANWRLESGELQPLVLAGALAAERLARRPDGVAAAVAAAAPGSGFLASRGRWLDLDADGRRWRLGPIGLEVPARLLGPSEAAALLELRHASCSTSAAARPGAAPGEEARRAGAARPDAPAAPRSAVARPTAPAQPSPAEGLPAPGPVEVRLLRALPDLVGDLRAPATSAVVQLVAFLALHGNRATTTTLRDALGVYRRDRSTREKTVYNAASATRKALGPAYFPLVTGNEPYRLAPSVTCDWLRFRAAGELAETARRTGDLQGELAALQFAVDLVGDGAPASDKAVIARFLWLDAELLSEDITYGVLAVAYRLGTLGFGLGDLDLVAHAVDRGRQVAPESDQLRELAMLLADARGDRKGVTRELEAHVELVDSLRLGADVSERIESLVAELQGGGPAPRDAGS